MNSVFYGFSVQIHSKLKKKTLVRSFFFQLFVKNPPLMISGNHASWRGFLLGHVLIEVYGISDVLKSIGLHSMGGFYGIFILLRKYRQKEHLWDFYGGKMRGSKIQFYGGGAMLWRPAPSRKDFAT